MFIHQKLKLQTSTCLSSLRFKKTKNHQDSDKESFDMSRGDEGFDNKAWMDSEFKQRHSLEVQPDFDNDSVKTNKDSVRGRQMDSNGSLTTSL